jgi:hypothetical protein
MQKWKNKASTKTKKKGAPIGNTFFATNTWSLCTIEKINAILLRHYFI